VEAERRAELSRSNDEFESRVSALLNDTQSVSEGPQGFIREARLLGAVVVFDGSVPGEDLRERQRAACRGIRERLSSAVDPRRRTALTALADGALALLCAWLPGPDGAVQRESAASLLKSVQAWLDGACREDIRATVIQTAECSGFPAARRELEEASRLAAQRVLLGVGRLLSLEEARAAARGRDAPLSAALERAALAWEAGNRLEFSAGIAAARRALADGALASGGRAAGEAGLQPAWGNLVRFLGAAFGFRPEAGRQPWLDALEAHGAALADSRGAGGGLVEQVVSFVQANFADNGGIGAIAGRLGVTPNYLSSLFHRSQGVTFVRYVTGLRMEEAQRLLAAGARVRDAARAVGYASTRHFSTLFFRHFGRHPSQRRSHAPGRPKSEKIAPEE
jgi:two-component system response regulator YesN